MGCTVIIKLSTSKAIATLLIHILYQLAENITTVTSFEEQAVYVTNATTYDIMLSTV